MDSIIRRYLHAREAIARLSSTQAIARFAGGQARTRLTRGQTMTEYALILAAVAIAVFLTYQTMGNNIQALAQEIDTKLAAAASAS
jgi:Flp pilus assembly pilin Flp